MRRRTVLAGATSWLAIVTLGRPRPAKRGTVARKDPGSVPPLPREFRGLWVATVANIDWPSKPGLSAARQREELDSLLDRARALRLNSVILQVRPACDALYSSDREPWSEFLTGEMGRDPGWDPLAHAVSAAHARGLELHAWFNPFRARPAGRTGPVDPSHVCARRPEWVRRYGNQTWLDPADPEVQRHSLDVILDVVRRYDVDGVHLDDYFYPYPEKDAATGEPIEFPDGTEWKRYRDAGGTLMRDDWRRAHVDSFIERLYMETKAIRRDVRVGISPFGIWRPGNPAQIRGLDAFASLFADSRKWLRLGWLDYCAPQLYWRIDQTAQSFPALLAWWTNQNPSGRHIWPGLHTSKHSSTEIEYQTKVTRGTAGAGGNVHFSAKSLLAGAVDDPSCAAGHLATTVYREHALPPPSPWLGETVPPEPTGVRLDPSAIRFDPAPAGVARVGVQWFESDVWRHVVLPPGATAFPISAEAIAAAVTWVDRLGNASRTVRVDR
ncbi:MAG: glycoside hydrolase family 10 protein [Armatimonadota bacterium]